MQLSDAQQIAFLEDQLCPMCNQDLSDIKVTGDSRLKCPECLNVYEISFIEEGGELIPITIDKKI